MNTNKTIAILQEISKSCFPYNRAIDLYEKSLRFTVYDFRPQEMSIVYRDLQYLRQQGLLERYEGNKGVYWSLTPKGEELELHSRTRGIKQ